VGCGALLLRKIYFHILWPTVRGLINKHLARRDVDVGIGVGLERPQRQERYGEEQGEQMFHAIQGVRFRCGNRPWQSELKW